MSLNFLKNAPLGEKISLKHDFSHKLLFPIERALTREASEIKATENNKNIFNGVDIWNAYEISWLNNKGKPEVATGEFTIPCHSPFLIESKSLKLYLNSLNQTKFNSKTEVELIITKHLSELTQSKVLVSLSFLEENKEGSLTSLQTLPGLCIDSLDVTIDTYTLKPSFLKNESSTVVRETLYSNLLKSNCLKTNQADWASVQIEYEGEKICHASLLKYIVSHRSHQGFHEDTVEKIFFDIKTQCRPKTLSVYARYTRRGGLDINPFRTDQEIETPPKNTRLIRQ